MKQLYVTLFIEIFNHAHIAFESLFILLPICLKKIDFSFKKEELLKQFKSCLILHTIQLILCLVRVKMTKDKNLITNLNIV